jgi:hypothetical protein
VSVSALEALLAAGRLVGGSGEVLVEGRRAAVIADGAVGRGMTFYGAPPAIVAAAIADMPADVKPVIRDLGGKAYAAYATELYGTATPSIRDDFKWLPDTAANMRLLTPAGAIPAGFTQVSNAGAGN